MSRFSSVDFCSGVSHSEKEALQLAENGDRRWILNDSPLVTYGGGHDMSVEPTPLLASFLDRLAAIPSGAVLDVAGGANARSLRDLHTLGLARTALVTNYEDGRTNETRALPWLGHIDGDLIDPTTWSGIENWKKLHAPQGFSGILHEPVAALQDLPKSFYLGAVHTLIDWTMSGGALLVSVPKVMADRDSYLNITSRQDVSEVRTNGSIVNHALIIKS